MLTQQTFAAYLDPPTYIHFKDFDREIIAIYKPLGEYATSNFSGDDELLAQLSLR